jgi:hypothetical protein
MGMNYNHARCIFPWTMMNNGRIFQIALTNSLIVNELFVSPLADPKIWSRFTSISCSYLCLGLDHWQDRFVGSNDFVVIEFGFS